MQQNSGNNQYGNSNSNVSQMYHQQQQQQQQPQQNSNGKSPNGYGSSWNMNALNKMKGSNGSHQWLLNHLREFNGNIANNDCLGKSAREHTNSDKLASAWR